MSVVVAASSAVYVFSQGDPTLATFVGLLAAALSVFDTTCSPGEYAVEWEFHRRRFGQLMVDAPDLTLAELDRRMRQLQNEGPNKEWDVLRTVAFRGVLVDERSRTQHRSLTPP